jgi:hypothetical protein
MTAVAVERSTAVQTRRGVPWKTVLFLGIVLAYADGYWMASLRGAVGSITRTQGPFASWLRESTLSIPFFVLAVLAAVTVSLRLFGAERRSWRTTLATSLLVIVAGTIVGVAELALSSGYDFVLQSHQLIRMNAIHPMCLTPGCLEVEQARSLWLQVHSVAYGAGFILLTNVVMVAWVVAMLGGRVKLAKDRPAIALGVMGRAPEARVDRLVITLAIVLVAAAIVHAAVMPAFVGLWAVGGLVISTIAAVQLLVAAWLLVAPGRWAFVSALLVTAVPLTVWVVSHTIGMAVAPGTRTPTNVGLAASAATLLELAAFAVALILVVDGPWVARPATASEHVRWMVLIGVLALTLLGLAGSGLPGLSDYGPGDPPLPTSQAHQHSTSTSGLRFDTPGQGA